MHKSILSSFLFAVVCLASTSLVGCATPGDTGIVTGGVLGGVTGSALTGGSTAGTVMGAVGGALIGRDIARRNNCCYY